MQLRQDKIGEPFERKNLQPRVAGQQVVRQKLAFQLESRLLGRE